MIMEYCLFLIVTFLDSTVKFNDIQYDIHVAVQSYQNSQLLPAEDHLKLRNGSMID